MRASHRRIRFPFVLALAAAIACLAGGAWSLIVLIHYACTGTVVDGWVTATSLREIRVDPDPICVWNVEYAFVDANGIEHTGSDRASERGAFRSEDVAVEYLRDSPDTSRLLRNRGMAWLGCVILFVFGVVILFVAGEIGMRRPRFGQEERATRSKTSEGVMHSGRIAPRTPGDRRSRCRPA
jgi:hypothetical protein